MSARSCFCYLASAMASRRYTPFEDWSERYLLAWDFLLCGRLSHVRHRSQPVGIFSWTTLPRGGHRPGQNPSQIPSPCGSWVCLCPRKCGWMCISFHHRIHRQNLRHSSSPAGSPGYAGNLLGAMDCPSFWTKTVLVAEGLVQLLLDSCWILLEYSSKTYGWK